MKVDTSYLIRGYRYALSHYYDNADSGAPILVFLHGYLGSRYVFDPLIDALTSRYNIVAIDLLGHGESDGSRAPHRYNAHEQAQDLYRILSKLKEKGSGRLYLYGYSMGGRLAIKLAVTYPEILDRLILESAGTGISSESEKRKRALTEQKWGDNIVADFQQFIEGWEQAALFQNPAQTADPEHYAVYRNIQRNQNPAYMAAALRGFGQGTYPPLHQSFESLNHPVTLISGEYDQKYHDWYRTLNSRMSRSTWHPVADAAHRVHLDQPGKIAEILEQLI